MPLPWKKTKGSGSRISRWVADLQSPPRRGGSLVVETGFPTSLVDLFVKNRDRLKKQSKKKSQSQPTLEISSPFMASSPPPCYDKSRMVVLSSGCQRNEPRNETKSTPTPTPVQEAIVGKECDSNDDHDGAGCDDASKKRNVWTAVLRVFFVVVLALSTKRLALGITKSAFLLLLLEFVLTRVLRFLRPCSKASAGFNSFLEKVKILCFSNSKKEEIERCEEDSTKACTTDVCDSSVEEIQAVESNHVEVIYVEEIRDKKADTEPVSGDGRGRRSDMETKERTEHKNEEKVDVLVCKREEKVDVLVCKKEQRRSSKMRATFVKKLVPRKLRISKKGKQTKEKEMESNAENGSGLGEDKQARIHRLEDQQNKDNQQEHDSESNLSQFREEECDDEVTTQSQTESEMTTSTIEVTMQPQGKGNSGYLILCSIALAGLVGGRVLALVLIVGWCVGLKLARVTISS